MEIMVYQTSQIPPRNELKHKIITKKSAICLAIKEKFPYLNGLKDLGLLSETELLVAKSKSSVEKAIYKGVELALNKPTNILHFYDYTFDDCYLERYPELNSIKRDLDAADKEEITAVVLQNEATSFSTSHNYMIPSSGAASPGSSTTEGTAMSEEPGQSSTECRGLIHTHIISTVDDLEAADNEEITAVALQNEVLSPLPYHNCMIPGSGAASPGNSTTEAFQDEAPSFSSNQNYMIPNSIVASQVSSTTEEQFITDIKKITLKRCSVVLHRLKGHSTMERILSKDRNEIMKQFQSEEYKDKFPVTCDNKEGLFITDKWKGDVRKDECVRVGETFMTPRQFEIHGGKKSNKKWKVSIKFKGVTLETLEKAGLFKPNN